jgi:HAD superfamily 5'-nucleotidase-like hydrolase
LANSSSLGSELASADLGPVSANPERGVFCNRTLNLRSIRAIGYDMDYSLIHYRVEVWEHEAFEHVRDAFLARGWPVNDLKFDPHSVTRGLTIDLDLGNLIKPNRFGYVIRAEHGTRTLSFDALRRTYARTAVDLSADRFVFLNTMFSYSEACLYSQLVDLFDARKIPDVPSYAALYGEVRATLDETHREGTIKDRIVANPERFVELEPETPLALLDQHYAGKKLMLITNSEWSFTRAMMTYAFDQFLPEGLHWRDLFDLVIVSAGKPDFFEHRHPLYEVVDEEKSLLHPCETGFREGGVFFRGNAALVEEHFGLVGDEILYVGDHLFGDVQVSKGILGWRTALILREMEDEMRALSEFAPKQLELTTLMEQKELLERRLSQVRLREQRARLEYGPEATGDADRDTISDLREQIEQLDERIAPLARESGTMVNEKWGPLMRAGADKSLFARQVERYADVYTSRVSNFLDPTPFFYFRAPRGSLPHDG